MHQMREWVSHPFATFMQKMFDVFLFFVVLESLVILLLLGNPKNSGSWVTGVYYIIELVLMWDMEKA